MYVHSYIIIIVRYLCVWVRFQSASPLVVYLYLSYVCMVMSGCLMWPAEEVLCSSRCFSFIFISPSLSLSFSHFCFPPPLSPRLLRLCFCLDTKHTEKHNNNNTLLCASLHWYTTAVLYYCCVLTLTACSTAVYIQPTATTSATT